MERKLLNCTFCGWHWFAQKNGNNCGKCPKCHNDYAKERIKEENNIIKKENNIIKEDE